jgi:alpha-pyrone synthase
MPALGTANPPYRQQQSLTAEIIATTLAATPAQKRLINSIYRMSGIEYRHSVLSDFCKRPGEFTVFPNDTQTAFPSTKTRMTIYQTHACELALAAINNCTPAFDKNTITHLITVSCTGMYAPGLDIELTQRLNLSPQVQRTAIQFMGCYAAFNALKAAAGNSQAKVLIVSVELCTLHFAFSKQYGYG